MIIETIEIYSDNICRECRQKRKVIHIEDVEGVEWRSRDAILRARTGARLPF